MAESTLHGLVMTQGGRDPEPAGSFPLSALVGSTVVGLAGAIGAAFALAMCSRVCLGLGWLDWALGAVVGVAAVAMGARGQRAAMVVALLSFVAMLVGRTLLLHLVLHGLWHDLSQSAYEWTRVRARELAALPAEAEDRRIKQFMVRNGYAEEREDPDRVTDQELAEFVQRTAPMLRRFAVEQPTIEAWWASDPLLQEGIKEPRLIDGLPWMRLAEILFVLLGMSTAYVLVKHGGWYAAARNSSSG